MSATRVGDEQLVLLSIRDDTSNLEGAAPRPFADGRTEVMHEVNGMEWIRGLEKITTGDRCEELDFIFFSFDSLSISSIVCPCRGYVTTRVIHPLGNVSFWNLGCGRLAAIVG